MKPITEIPFKRWVLEQSAREACGPSGVLNRFYAGEYPQLKIRRVNARVVWVAVGKSAEAMPVNQRTRCEKPWQANPNYNSFRRVQKLGAFAKWARSHGDERRMVEERFERGQLATSQA